MLPLGPADIVDAQYVVIFLHHPAATASTDEASFTADQTSFSLRVALAHDPSFCQGSVQEILAPRHERDTDGKRVPDVATQAIRQNSRDRNDPMSLHHN
jgi:hypothetical protein